ncbi:DUF4267 domain-containing protein [Kribbella pittospori]|uniref:DUF4267 domain-containing protein n=1 Tax=Kribbella pittospori TaxID=722689 RepID=A0A4R0KKW9_9ACTN|nr:DUF4267 domain-containing protein [Kribbella pittospori]TCC60407.1 DUF4267 domain-containing protein [Kribbella pittospori]
MRRFVTVLTVLLGLFPISFGLWFLFDGHSAAAGFGIDPWPTGTAAGYFPVKGIRDTVYGLIILVLFALGERRATGIVMALATLIPVTDMIVVLTHDGPVATALGVHGLTAVVVLFDAWLLLRERSAVAAVAQPVGAHS